MEATEKSITEAEGFAIIQKMINTVKSEIDDNTFYNLLWGWLVFAASLSHYFLLQAGSEHPYIAWMLMPVGAVATLVYAWRHERKKKIRTYVDDLMKYVLVAFLVCLCIVLSFMSKLGFYTYPMVMLVYGIWLFISGGAIRFKPMMAGGIFNWILAIVAFFVPDERQLLLLALAAISGYVIPSYLLRKKQAAHV